MEITGRTDMPSQHYAITCFHCGANLKYSTQDILRNPAANFAVRKHGFTGHTGEIRCPGCGTFLPHYETNILMQ